MAGRALNKLNNQPVALHFFNMGIKRADHLNPYYQVDTKSNLAFASLSN
jgi:hypothetical protein